MTRITCSAFVAVLGAVMTSALAGPARSYTLTQRSPLEFNDYLYPFGINESGTVAGYHGIPPQKPFLWTPQDGLRIFTELPGNEEALAWDINNSGQIVGWRHYPNGHSFVLDPDGTYTSIDPFPGGARSMATAINNHGVVTGFADLAGDTRSSFIRSASGDMSIVSGIPSRNSARSINDHGAIAGDYGQGDSRAFLWTPQGGFVDIGDLPTGPVNAGARDVNNRNEVVGTGGIAVDPMTNPFLDTNRAFYWSAETGMIDLGALPNTVSVSVASAINNHGEVVGSSGSGTTFRPFLWTKDSGMIDLNNHLDESGQGWVLRNATDINDAGQIIGQGLHDGITQAYLLTPNIVPEPAAVLTLAIGALLASRRRRV